MTGMVRKHDLLEAVTQEVHATGLIGLTLRPLARAVGTSDRMLIYHFGDRDSLVSEVVDHSCDQGVAALDALAAPDGVRAGVNALWAAYQGDALHPVLTTYHQAAASGLLGQEPYLSRARASNARWAEALRRYLVRCGAPAGRVDRVARLVDPALYGCHVDLVTSTAAELTEAVDDLARAAERLAHEEPVAQRTTRQDR